MSCWGIGEIEMIVEFTMPMLGEVMQEGTVMTWFKQVGDPIEKGEILLEVETDKAVMEVESNATGIIKALLIAEGNTVPVNTIIAQIEVEG